MMRSVRSARRQTLDHSDTVDVDGARSPWRRRIARLVVTVSAIGAVSATAPSAFATEGALPPPEQSVAAPSESSVPQTGDQDYWASDYCHYYAQGGTWWSDMCMFSLVDDAGNVLPNLYSNFQNLGDGNYGRELLRMDLNDPNYVAFATVTDVVGEWYVAGYGASSAVLGYTIDGQPIWVTPLPPEYVQMGGNTGGSLPYVSQTFDMWQQTQLDMAEDTIGIVLNPYDN